MAFAIVEFLNSNDVAVVPLNWVRGNKCLWPPKKLMSKLAPFVEKGITASDTWDLYSIKTLGIFATYREARLKLPTAEEKSDLNSTDPEDCGRGKRVKHLRRLSTSSTDSEDILRNNNAALELEVTPTFDAIVDVQPTCSFTLSTEKGVGHANENSESLLNASSKSNHSDIPSASPSILAFQRTVLREINILKTNQKYIMEALDSVSKHLASENKVTGRLDDNLLEDLTKLLPMKNNSDLVFIEDKLQDEDVSHQMILYLNRLGGVNVEQGLKLMLRRLLTDEVASTFSLMGLRGKKSFQMTNLYKVIMGTVRNHSLWKDTFEKDIERVVSNWLRHAKGRIQQKKLYLIK